MARYVPITSQLWYWKKLSLLEDDLNCGAPINKKSGCLKSLCKYT